MKRSELKALIKEVISELNLDEVNVTAIGGTSGNGGQFFMGQTGLKKMAALSKKNPNIEYTVQSDNYGNFQLHWLKNGKYAKKTVANINYDLDKNAVRGMPKKDVNDTIFKLTYR